MAASPDGNGTAQLAGTGLPGVTYTIEANNDLNTTKWLLIGTATADPQTGALQYIDTDAPNHAQRFYRLIAP